MHKIVLHKEEILHNIAWMKLYLEWSNFALNIDVYSIHVELFGQF